MAEHDETNEADWDEAYGQDEDTSGDVDDGGDGEPESASLVPQVPAPRVQALTLTYLPPPKTESKGRDEDAHLQLEYDAKMWLRNHGVSFNVASNSFFWRGNNKSTQQIAAQLHASKTWRTPGGLLRRHSPTLWATVVAEVAVEHRNNAIAYMRSSLCEAPRTDDAELRRFLRELLHVTIDAEEFENCVAVVKHWLWLVQRQILGLKTTWHMMPIFWGGQGGGKSEQLKQLLGQVGNFAILDANFSVFSDGFSQLQMNRSFVMFMDEMENVEKTDSQAIKRAISAEHIAGRGMYSDDGRKLRRNASFIAATNLAPPHGLKDTSGARRYYSLECRPGPITEDRIAFFNGLDYLAMWTCVDPHDKVSPMMPRQVKIMAVQHEVNRAKSLYEDFIAERCEKSDGAVYLYRDFVRDLKLYIEDRKLLVTVPSYVQLRIELKALGWSTTNPNNVPRVVGLVNRSAATVRMAQVEMGLESADSESSET